MSFSPLLIRIFTTIIAGIPIVAGTVLGDIFFLVLLVTLTMLSVNELYFMAGEKNKNYSYGIIANCIAVIVIFCAFLEEINFIWSNTFFALLVLSSTVVWIIELSRRKLWGLDSEIFLAIRTIFYIGIPFSFLILIRESTSNITGLFWMFFLISSVWINDAMAYVFGIKFGKHRLNEEVSPKKSVEGAIAGFVFCITWAIFVGEIGTIGITHSVVLGIIISILAQAGDLTESLLKREMKVKDSGSLLPGHGGMLDRMDSFILTAPVLYYYGLFFKLF